MSPVLGDPGKCRCGKPAVWTYGDADFAHRDCTGCDKRPSNCSCSSLCRYLGVPDCAICISATVIANYVKPGAISDADRGSLEAFAHKQIENQREAAIQLFMSPQYEALRKEMRKLRRENLEKQRVKKVN